MSLADILDSTTLNEDWKRLYVQRVITSSDLTVGGDETIAGNLTVSGTINGGTVSSSLVPDTDNAYNLGATPSNRWANLYLGSNAVIGGNETVAGTLGVTGATTLSTLGTSGLATLNSGSVTGNLSVGGNETVTGTLGVTGATTLSTVNTSGLATLNSGSVTNNLSVGGNETVTGTLGVTGVTTLSTVNTSSLATLNSGSVTNNLAVGGNITVTGTIQGSDVIQTSSILAADDRVNAPLIQALGASNQLVFTHELGNATVINSVDPAAPRIYTIRDCLNNGDFMISTRGTVSQTLDITEPVTINHQTAMILTTNTTLAGASATSFTVNNSIVTASSIIIATIDSYSGSYGGSGFPQITISNIGSGSFEINVMNVHATNPLNGQIRIGFIVC